MSVLEPLTRADPASSSPFVPAATGKAVVRTALLNRLCSTKEGAIVTIVAPAGFGKTTLLAQWAERDRRPVVWIDLEPEDDDAEILESRLDGVADQPGVLTLVDDVHVVRSSAAVAVLVRLLGRTAHGTSVALAARRPPALPLARLRAGGRLLEIGMDELTLKDREAETLLRRAGVLLPRQETAALAERLEGWPAALFLAALSLRNGAQASTIGGDDRFLADYLDTEHLAGLSSAQRKFALQTSVLAELTSEECDSLLARSDSAQMLESLERSGVAVPLDHRRRRYRYPRIVRDLLSTELERSEPEQARALHRAAAGRAVEIGAVEEALEHAAAAGDVGRVADLAERLAVSACGRGRLDALQRWLDLVHEDDVEHYPDLCIAASWLHALRGRAGNAQHWADTAMRGLSADDPRLFLLRGLRCRDGADQMLDDTTAACETLPPGHPWRPAAVFARAAALLLADETARAESELVLGIELATAAGATELATLGLCLRSLLAAGENDGPDAEAFAAEADSLPTGASAPQSLVALLLEAVGARNAARRGDVAEATAALGRADQLLPFATPAVPWLAAYALLELARVRLALADADGARALLRRVGDIVRVRPRLGLLVEQSAALDRHTHALSEPEGRWASSLTPAEQRLLPLLATHLSFREIGERLYVSRNTVKTQAIAVYRKFGVTSRSAAIERAVALGLIDEAAAVPAEGLRWRDLSTASLRERSGMSPAGPPQPGAAAETNAGTLTWLGHSCAVIRVDGHLFVTDPVLRDRIVHLRRKEAVDAAALAGIDMILLSHTHHDHLDLPSLGRLDPGAEVLVPAGAGGLLRRRGFRSVREVVPGDEVAIGSVRVRVTHAEHAAGFRMGTGKTHPVGYVVAGTQTVYFAGDTDLFRGMGALGRVDVALLPVAGWGPRLPAGHLDPARAVEALELIEPRLAIPIHWGTYAPWRPPRGDDTSAKAFAELAATVVPTVDVRVLRPGQSCELDYPRTAAAVNSPGATRSTGTR